MKLFHGFLYKIGNIKRINTKSSFFAQKWKTLNVRLLLKIANGPQVWKEEINNLKSFQVLHVWIWGLRDFESGKQQRFGNFKTFLKLLHRSHHMDFLFQNRAMHVIYKKVSTLTSQDHTSTSKILGNLKSCNDICPR